MSTAINWATCVMALCCVVVTGAHAQVFDVALGSKQLGTLAFSHDGTKETLLSSLDNTPMGVFNGTFKATTQRSRAITGGKGLRYQSLSQSSRKTRKIAISIDDGRVVKTAIKPTSERTKLSNIDIVPRGMIDPVTAIGTLIAAKQCPPKIMIYDGRRAIALIPDGSTKNANRLTCAIQYKVVAGPGHLSPLYISSVKMKVTYDLSNGAQKLTKMKLGSGLFNLVLSRKN